MTFIHEPLELTYGELVCETLPSGRTYVTPEGKKYPSITTVLGVHTKDVIHEWRQRVGEEEANRVSRVAAGRGSEAHALVEKFLKNEPVSQKESMPNAWAAFNSVKDIFAKRVGKIYLQEKPLYSNHLRVAGRVDLVAEFNGKPSIIDFKTSKRVKTEEDIHTYFMQEAAYAIMVEERTGLPITRLVTIMAVDFSEPLVFIQKRDDWTKPLLETIAEYNRRKLYGHI